MKLETAKDQWANGARMIVVEYRSSKMEQIAWRDKTSGKSMSAWIVRHHVECGTDIIQVSERTGDDFRPERWTAPPFAKGQRVILQFESFAVERGNITARGTLAAIDPPTK